MAVTAEVEGGHKSSQLWKASSPREADGSVQLHSEARQGMCLSAETYSVDLMLGKTTSPSFVIGADVFESWCLKSTNMWRTSTDVLQTWPRIMMQIESMVGMGRISRPGAWAFPDALELGVPGLGVMTWSESKASLALYAITSSPLLLSNDVANMQPRLLALVKNRLMLDVNQAWEGFAGDRIWTGGVGLEVWAKPIRKPNFKPNPKPNPNPNPNPKPKPRGLG